MSPHASIALDIPGAPEIAAIFGSGEPAAGPPLLLVHAAGGAARNFGSLLRRLPPSAVAIDLPGHGRTGGEAPRTIDESAAILAAVARRLAPAGAVGLGGHSMGGAVALAAAALEGRGRVAAVVTFGTGARLGIAPERARLARADFEAFLAALAASGTPAMIVEALRRAGRETVARDLEATAGFDAAERARRYGGPLLAMGGGADSTAPPECVRALAEANPLGEAMIIEGAGHLLPVERPDEVAAAVRAFLARTGGRGIFEEGRSGSPANEPARPR